MRFFIDNNLGINLARGMYEFGEPVEHLQDHFNDDVPDIEWLEFIGKNNYFLIFYSIEHSKRKAFRKGPSYVLKYYLMN